MSQLLGVRRFQIIWSSESSGNIQSTDHTGPIFLRGTEPTGTGLPPLDGTDPPPLPISPRPVTLYCLHFTRNRPSSYCLLKAEKCVTKLLLHQKWGDGRLPEKVMVWRRKAGVGASPLPPTSLIQGSLLASAGS